jgi:pyruvate/2-oxoglutarate dehydrogenase complex dihydrolipoamide acyltransferase (E2) component
LIAEMTELAPEAIPFTRIQRAMAKRMSQAALIPNSHQFVFVTMNPILDLLEARRRGGMRVTLNSVLLSVAAQALTDYPLIAAEIDYDASTYRLRRKLDVGIAVSTDAGLFVPVIRDVAGRTPAEIEPDYRAVVEQIQAGKRHLEMFTGGCFSITNLGREGVDGGIPIPAHPQLAIMGISRIKPTVVAVERQPAVRDVARIGLTFDHRILDGRTTGNFLRTVQNTLENPPNDWAR